MARGRMSGLPQKTSYGSSKGRSWGVDFCFDAGVCDAMHGMSAAASNAKADRAVLTVAENFVKPANMAVSPISGLPVGNVQHMRLYWIMDFCGAPPERPSGNDL